jgi:hypothetical protein
MATLAGRPLFTIGEHVYAWEDVIAAACLWGDWTALEARVRDGLACLRRHDELADDDDEALDEAEVDAATDEFRYARDLIAAADLEAWLDERALTVDALLDFVRRTLLRTQWTDELPPIRARYDVDRERLAAAMACEAVCSGLAADVCGKLAARAAIHACAPEAGSPVGDAAPVSAEAYRAAERALPELAPDARHARLAEIARLDTTWHRFTAEIAPAEAVQAIVDSRRLDWMRLAIERTASPDEDVAREIALCVREDGRPIAEVAAEAGIAIDRAEVWLEDVDGPLRDALAGARAGDVLGPLLSTDGHVVVVVHGKQLPSEADAAVRERAERELLARTVDREVTNRVTWHQTL